MHYEHFGSLSNVAEMPPQFVVAINFEKSLHTITPLPSSNFQ